MSSKFAHIQIFYQLFLLFVRFKAASQGTCIQSQVGKLVLSVVKRPKVAIYSFVPGSMSILLMVPLDRIYVKCKLANKECY